MKEQKTIEDRAKEFADSKYLQSNHHYDRQSCEEGYLKGYESAEQELSNALPSDEEIENETIQSWNYDNAFGAKWLKQQILKNIK